VSKIKKKIGYVCVQERMKNICKYYIGCSFKFILKVGVEEAIVNAPRITDHRSPVSI
jgi:hypothetical protein